MTDKPPQHLYRVVGIRVNGQRIVIGHGLTSEEAKRVREALVEANVFTGITIEVEIESGTIHP